MPVEFPEFFESYFSDGPIAEQAVDVSSLVAVDAGASEFVVVAGLRLSLEVGRGVGMLCGYVLVCVVIDENGDVSGVFDVGGFPKKFR